MTTPPKGKARKFFEDNGLTLAFAGLFLVCVVTQGLTGWRAYEGARAAAALPGVGFGAFLRTGTFLDGIFVNWQAALLQLAMLVVLSAVLRQRGAAHSRKPSNEARAPLPPYLSLSSRKHGAWLQNNSLSLAMFTLFAGFFALHALTGAWKHDEEQALRHLQPEGLAAYVGSWDFCVSIMETWEAEFFAIALYIVLSIFLRQARSSESKPVGASDRETGDTNE
jgi:hypothetical protein